MSGSETTRKPPAPCSSFPLILLVPASQKHNKHLDHQTHILPYLGQIKDLAIWYTRIPAYSADIDLLCVHSLQKFVLEGSTYSWMVGRTFHTLGSAVAYALFSHPNVQILEICPLATPDETLLKFLHNYLYNCPHLQDLKVCGKMTKGEWCG
jgi:hypothetical protein